MYPHAGQPTEMIKSFIEWLNQAFFFQIILKQLLNHYEFLVQWIVSHIKKLKYENEKHTANRKKAIFCLCFFLLLVSLIELEIKMWNLHCGIANRAVLKAWLKTTTLTWPVFQQNNRSQV